jgi:hypothetical protein
MARQLHGTNYIPQDLEAKFTGRARYAEDFRADGMLFAKLLLSPMPHARIVNIDTSAALAMDGVKAVLTAADVPGSENTLNESCLSSEALYEGQPIAAVAAVDELTAANAVEALKVELEPLPFALDPIESLRPGSPNARLEGNALRRVPVEGGRPRPEVYELKWTEEDFANAPANMLPLGEPEDEWVVGDLEQGFAEADGVIIEAIEQLSAKGVTANHLQIKWIVPFHAEAVNEILSGAKQTIIVENNFTGQFARYLRSETGFSADGHIRKYDGEPFMPHHVADGVLEQLAGKVKQYVPLQEVIV